ncbi:MAG: hypothetical protein IPN09_07540 [Bacteroidetes bacterium]|nr:hypothetical protein [Bacteroidota bacterium]
MQIALDEVIDVPLRMNLNVPLNTELLMNDVLDLESDLPVDIMLSPDEIQLKHLVIPFRKELNINDSIPLNVNIPMDTKIRTNFKHFLNMTLPVKGSIPVSLMVPIQQKLQVDDTLILNAEGYDIPFKTTIPVKGQSAYQSINIH